MGILDRLVKEQEGVDVEESRKGEVRKELEAGGAEIAFEIDSGFDLSAFESEEGGTSEHFAPDEAATRSPAGKIAWGQIQTEILDAVLDDNDIWGGEYLQALALRLRSTLEDFEQILEMTDESEWNKQRLERLLQRERILHRDFDWDVIESAATAKLGVILQSRTVKTAEILAIAQAANRATRRKGVNQMPPGGNTNINVYQGNGNAEIQLPGSGHLGSMKLTLSAKTVGQLSKGITIDATAEKYTDGIEMLGGDDVPQLSKLADES